MTNLLEKITKAYNDKQFLRVINLFEVNFLRQDQSSNSSRANITQAYLHLYAKSLLNLVIYTVFLILTKSLGFELKIDFLLFFLFW